eukprot:4578917-Prorocentrum_lima.AAC.1
MSLAEQNERRHTQHSRFKLVAEQAKARCAAEAKNWNSTSTRNAFRIGTDNSLFLFANTRS